MEIREKTEQQTVRTVFARVGIGVAALLPLAALGYLSVVHMKMRRASRRGRAVSARISSTELPLTTFLRDGKAGDPINLQILGTDGQLGAAFALAGWYRADEIDLVTSLRISFDSLFNRAYSTAPVSNLYLYGRKEDLAFERPGTSVRQRDHARFWKTEIPGSDERPTWVGSATKDVKVELSKTDFLPTHGIAPDIDDERDLVVSELAQTGWVVAETARPGFGKETRGFNGGGDPYVTDGQVAVLKLANVWTMPLITQVRGTFFARLVRRFERIIRRRLPAAGRARAERERERIGKP
jgi:hypothetical protein